MEARLIDCVDLGRGLQSAHTPMITGWGTVTSPVPLTLLARHVPFMHVAGGGGGKPGRCRLGRRVGPDSLHLRRPYWSSGGGRASTRPFIRSEGGGWHSHILQRPSSSTSAPSFHSSWREGAQALQRWEQGLLVDNASLLPKRSRWRSRPREEGEGGEAEVVIALGEEGDGAARRPRLRQRCPFQWKATLGRVLRQAASATASPPPSPYSILSGDGARFPPPRPSGCT